MSTPLTADRLLKALKDEGLTVVQVGNWRTHNRNHKGPWGPVNGVMIHHTVTQGTAHTVELCRAGHSALPGPLCHGVIDKAGTVHLIASGRANHAGLGDDDVLRAVIAEKRLPADNEANTDGNRHFYGFECVNLGDGRDPWPAEQVEAIARAAAGICRAHGWGAASVIGHSEWQPGKVDPRGPIGAPDGPALTMARIRARVEQLLDDDKPTTPSTPSKPKPKPKPYAPPAFPKGLAPGRKAPSARGLQRALKAAGFMSKGIPEADSYGPATQTAVARFHQAHPAYRAAGLHYDPAIGPRGWAALHTVAYGKKK
ncbi:N-acetylmuramoyl-L-alanine amidase [Streptomyces sp. NBC_01237]|uniref:N-acetylmuramoyl-L-alanine amidase n=1 Tax=Streptomyces sp. NBC_01237 TaxID=2903790 RepID=UPI002DD9AC34|nr:N-acetylmuramoyl-L-alanine amidase [Streptomyces sp. NBC_01237]WRZ73771.1 N-acetylmuramoyl-L-alanine amidase [Streptomyces sp. NBC_01237]